MDTGESPGGGGPRVAVIGAGAAGLMAALFAARSGAEVVLLERTKDGGRKILISGGGRCNILPSVVRPDRYVTDSSPNTLRKILLSWPLAEQRSFFEKELGQPLVLEEESGKLFPESNRARDVRDGLVERVREAGARIWFEARVVDVVPPGLPSSSSAGSSISSPDLPPRAWAVLLDGAPPLEADRIVVATGGLSVPATGSDGTGLTIAEKLGHTLHATYPALTPLTADPPVHAHLAGVSLDVTLRVRSARFETRGGFLFTHRGYSGPAVLDASHLAIRSPADDPARLTVQWGDSVEVWEECLLAGGGAGGGGTLGGALRRELPDRLVAMLLEEIGLDPATPLNQLKRDARRAVIAALTDYPLPWTGDEGYKKAEVTGGGVSLAEVHPRTMESRRHPGLFFVGEVLDAFGPIGGHNFLWAWATGRAGGEAAGA